MCTAAVCQWLAALVGTQREAGEFELIPCEFATMSCEEPPIWIAHGGVREEGGEILNHSIVQNYRKLYSGLVYVNLSKR